VDLYVEAELPNNAIAVCKKVIRNVPDRHAIYLAMGQIRANQGFLPDARTNFLTYAERVAQGGDIEESLRALTEFTRLAPDDVEVRLFLAEQLAGHDRGGEAVDQLVRAHQVLQARGEEEEAEAVRERVHELDPDADLDDAPSGSTEMVIESGAGFVVEPGGGGDDEDGSEEEGEDPASASEALGEALTEAAAEARSYAEETPAAPGPAGHDQEDAGTAGEGSWSGEPDPDQDADASTPAPLGELAEASELEEDVEAEARPRDPLPEEESEEVAADPLPLLGGAPGDDGLDSAAGPGEDPSRDQEPEDRAEPPLLDEDEEDAEEAPELPLLAGTEEWEEEEEPLPTLGWEDDDEAPEGEGPAEAGQDPLAGPDGDVDEPAPSRWEEEPAEDDLPYLESWDEEGAQELPILGEAAAEADDLATVDEEVEELPTAGEDAEEGAPPPDHSEAEVEELPTLGEYAEEGAPPPDQSEAEVEELPTLGEAADEPGPAGDEEPAEEREPAEAELSADAASPREDVSEAVEEAAASGRDVADEPTVEEIRAGIEDDPDDLALRQRMVELAYRTEDEGELVDAYLGLARALERRGERGRARAAYQQVLEVDPTHEEARGGIRREGAEEEAVQEVAASEEYVDLGAMILGDGPEKTTRFTVEYEEPSGDEEADFAKMLSRFKDKVSENLDADDVKAHHDLGTAYKEMGLLDEAIAEFQAALRADAAHLPTYELMGQTFMEMGRPIQALRSLERALRAPYQVEDELVGIYYYLARAHEEEGNREEAVEFYDRVFSLDINFADVTERLRALRPS
jgi:tetratricopeptide (TPR) repeat protein